MMAAVVLIGQGYLPVLLIDVTTGTAPTYTEEQPDAFNDGYYYVTPTVVEEEAEAYHIPDVFHWNTRDCIWTIAPKRVAPVIKLLLQRRLMFSLSGWLLPIGKKMRKGG